MVFLRLYRAVALLIGCGVVLAALAVGDRTAPLPLPPTGEGVSGEAVLNQLRYLRTAFPSPLPGSPTERALAQYIASQFEADGFKVTFQRFVGGTPAGATRLTNVLATKAAANGGAPIVVVAHHDSRLPEGGALAATAELLGLAKYLGQMQTARPLVLASTSGGSGGFSGAAALTSRLAKAVLPAAAAPAAPSQEGEPAPPPARQQPVDAVLVIANPFGGVALEPAAQAGPRLATTAASALRANGLSARAVPSLPGAFGALALAPPPRESIVFADAGFPVASFGSARERPSSGTEQRIAAVGNAVLATVQALSTNPPPSGATGELPLAGKELPAWALRLFAAFAVAAAWLAAAGLLLSKGRGGRSAPASLSAASLLALPPFAAAGLLALVGELGGAGALAAPSAEGGGLRVGTAGWLLVSGAALILLGGLALAARWRRRLLGGEPVGLEPFAAAALLLTVAATLLWFTQPAASLVLVPTALVLPLAAALRRRAASAAVVALGLCPAVLLWLLTALSWPTGPLTVPVLFAAGYLSPFADLCWSIAFGGSLLALAAPLRQPASKRLEARLVPSVAASRR